MPTPPRYGFRCRGIMGWPMCKFPIAGAGITEPANKFFRPYLDTELTNLSQDNKKPRDRQGRGADAFLGGRAWFIRQVPLRQEPRLRLWQRAGRE